MSVSVQDVDSSAVGPPQQWASYTTAWVKFRAHHQADVRDEIVSVSGEARPAICGVGTGLDRPAGRVASARQRRAARDKVESDAVRAESTFQRTDWTTLSQKLGALGTRLQRTTGILSPLPAPASSGEDTHTMLQPYLSSQRHCALLLLNPAQHLGPEGFEAEHAQ